MTDSEIRNRDRWRCTAMRLVTIFHPNRPRRCTAMGSEMLVRDGRTLCPSCAGRLEAGEVEPLVSPRPRPRPVQVNAETSAPDAGRSPNNQEQSASPPEEGTG